MDEPGFGGRPPPIGGPNSGRMPLPMGEFRFGGMPSPFGGPSLGNMPLPMDEPEFGGMSPPIDVSRFGGMPDMSMGRRPKGQPNLTDLTDTVLNNLTELLILTDDEKAKIKPIIEQEVADFKKQMKIQHSATQKQFEDTKIKIKPLLDADQQKQLDTLPLPGSRPEGDSPHI
jgi:hypothetical protein